MRAATWINGTLALILLVVGLALRNCVFLGAAVLLGISAFYRYMDGFQSGHPMRAALSCIGAGTCAIATTFVMAIVLLTGAFGFWPSIDSIALVAGGLLATIAMITYDAMPDSRGNAFVPIEILIVVAAIVALGLAANGIGWIACLYAGAALTVGGAAGWHLAAETASALLRSGAQR